MAEVPISRQEAVDLIRKWMDEDRIVHITFTSLSLLAKILAKIDEVDDIHVRLSMKKSNVPLGEYSFAVIELYQAKFEFGAAEDAPEPLRSKIAGHDSLLYIYLPSGLGIGFAVLPEGYDRQ